MKIYAVADIHGAQYRINEVREVIQKKKPDLVCVCGDITQFGPADVATNLLDQIPGPVFVVPGNIDTADVDEGIKRSHAENIQMKRVDHQEISFLGLNGISETETFSFYTNQSNGYLFKNIDVLVTHVPPYGCQDTVFLGRHAGSKLLLEIMTDSKPRFVLCGHIHENPGVSSEGNTTIVNCSIGKRGNGAFIQFDKTIKVTML